MSFSLDLTFLFTGAKYLIRITLLCAIVWLMVNPLGVADPLAYLMDKGWSNYCEYGFSNYILCCMLALLRK